MKKSWNEADSNQETGSSIAASRSLIFLFFGRPVIPVLSQERADMCTAARTATADP
jgi:hypothetical protein